METQDCGVREEGARRAGDFWQDALCMLVATDGRRAICHGRYIGAGRAPFQGAGPCVSPGGDAGCQGTDSGHGSRPRDGRPTGLTGTGRLTKLYDYVLQYLRAGQDGQTH